ALPPYPEVQIEAVIELCTGILGRWDIPQTGIVGHSDIAPTRKEDPGEHFPWARLAETGIGLWPEINSSEGLDLIGRGLGRGDRGEAVKRMQAWLSEIGYTIEADGAFDKMTEAVVRAFQRRWVQDRVSGQADLLTLQMLDVVRALYAGHRR
ncbi:MAG: peptidoglycan-binding protein, partial [Pseudomonadota bacterium]